MTENLKKYLDRIISGIMSRKKYKDEIKRELFDHAENLYTDYLNKGFDPERAEIEVINVMGAPQELSNGFNTIIFKKAKKKIKRYAAKSILGLTAAYVLFISVNSAITYRRDYDKYENFLKGIDDGKVSVDDTMIDLLHSSNYKESDFLTRAIECYDEVSENHRFEKMLVTNTIIGILEDVE